VDDSDLNPSNGNFAFGTKAETLQNLQGRLTRGRLCEQIIVSKADWQVDAEGIIVAIMERFVSITLIVRSSARAEDCWDNSLAGAHLSVADVPPEKGALGAAINNVFASYTSKANNDQVLVQPMLEGVALSGVVMTRDLDTGSPYYVVNYDDYSGRTDTVTGGLESTTMLIRRSTQQSLRSVRIKKLIDCVVQLEEITGSHELDIEFCITQDEDVFILQVRPLAARHKWSALDDADVDSAIAEIRSDIAAVMQPVTGIAGNTTVFTEMTDWNPAEMIGNTPRPLALSLYKSLITDRIWAEARHTMGYRMVDGPLLTDFFGRPYIDVRKSFNSFLPQGTPDAIAEKLVDHQVAQLAANRELHDKVEFDICVTCWDFSAERARKRFADAGLSTSESADLEAALSTLTRVAVVAGANGIDALLHEANSLLDDRSDLDGLPPLQRIGILLDACRDKGTLNFSQLARHGFIGVQFLKSLVERKVLSVAEMEAFMYSIATVATSLANDFHAVTGGVMSHDAFLSRYGHLRPGTYDILSWRYDERPELYLGDSTRQSTEIAHTPFVLSEAACKRVEVLLAEAGYYVSATHLLNYIAAAIKGREQAKFAFTRVISDTLSILTGWGEQAGMSRDDLSFLPIDLLVQGADIDALKNHVARARDGFTLTRAIRLPHVILSANDVDVVRIPLGQPTFITSKSVTAEMRHLTSVEAPAIDGRIVLIESADPGFDWIFSHDIRGLITKYGGANSHMAIRCAEFGLPAAIGCGERLFDKLVKTHVVELNAAAKRLSTH
jgi:hypothetical protein